MPSRRNTPSSRRASRSVTCSSASAGSRPRSPTGARCTTTRPTPTTCASIPSRTCWWRASATSRRRSCCTSRSPRRRTSTSRRLSPVERGTSVELFALVDDDDARCLVGPVSAEVTPSVRNVWYGTTPRPVGPPLDSIPLLHSGDWRYTESLLGVGARLCVMGELRSHSELGDANAAALAKLHEWKENQRSLLARFDLDHDGKLSDAEWEAARAAAAREAGTEILESPIERVSVISQPTNGEPFLIAPSSPAAL